MAVALPAATHCPYCALQCAMTLTRPAESSPATRLRLPVEVRGRDFPTNRGGLCRKGWTSADVLVAPDRLTSPLIRRADGRQHKAGWDEALGLIADRLSTLRRAHGADAVAMFGGGGLTNEKAYQLGKFARVALGTRYVDYNGRFCMSSAAAAGNRSLGVDRGLPFPLADLGGAAAILLLGSNLAETMPPAVAHLSGARAAGGLIVVDPRRSATAALTDEAAGVHLQPVPGTDMVVLLGLLHLVWARGWVDDDYLARRTTGAADVRAAASLWWPERVERATGVSVETLTRAADILGAAAPAHGGAGAFVLTGRGVEQHVNGTDTVTLAIDLALALGLCGRVGSGYGCITGQGNGQGGREHGQKADQLPGYRSISDPAARAHVAAVWGVEPDDLPGPGVPAVELINRLGTPTGPRALLVHGSNLLVSAPDATRVRERLAALELLVVADIVPSETAELADVVLPVTQWAEEEGTMTTLEGRVVRRRAALAPPAGVRSELDIWSELADRLGCAARFPTEPAEVFDELARASAGGRADYSGLSHARLDDETTGLHWPVPAVADGSLPHPGTPRLFLDAFPTADGRARMLTVDVTGVDDDLRAEAPVYLVTGRLLEHYQSGAQTRRVPELVKAAGEGFVGVHPRLAAALQIEDGDLVEVTSGRGTATAPARLTTDLRPDTVFMPFHFGGTASANLVTNPATDPISGMPEFKVTAVSVRAVP
jgi:assimilatory nitrate reductase catalytic subunit